MHRDLKTDNLMIDQADRDMALLGKLLIIDLGLAQRPGPLAELQGAVPKPKRGNINAVAPEMYPAAGAAAPCVTLASDLIGAASVLLDVLFFNGTGSGGCSGLGGAAWAGFSAPSPAAALDCWLHCYC